MKVEYSLRVRQKLRQIQSYISVKLCNPTAAQAVISRILHGCSVLKKQPLIGMSVERSTGAVSDYRYIVVENYLAIYRVLDNRIRVVEIFDCRTDYVRFLVNY